MWVWYNPDYILNILSWADVASLFCTTSDSAVDDCIFVHIDDGITICFASIDNSIYLIDESNLPKLKPVTNYSYTNVVDENKLNFTTRELAGADTARSLFKALGFPSYSRYIYAIEHNLISNWTVNISDIKHALHIYGPELATIKGKTTRMKPLPLSDSIFAPIPKSILDHHRYVTLAIVFSM